ncbi:hypothetical protein [Fimbriiglobus ruber]|nr:hypothetical protein [Fimbriiglobus ruber]
MASVQTALSSAMQIEGAIGVCVVDSKSGMVLGKEGGGNLNLDVAAAGNTEVLRAKLKAANSLKLKDSIEDILITLSSQYHLIRPVSNNPTLFIYLALNKAQANLAMARYKLEQIESDLAV